MTAKNYYEILQVSRKAGKPVIDAAWKTLAKVYDESSPERYLINEAHDVLENPARRKAFDESLYPKKDLIRIGNYRLIDEISEGRYGSTYRGQHEVLGELVCIKHCTFISAADEARMMEEAKAVWNLSHWGIPAVHDFIRLEDGSVAIVMSYVPGPNLLQYVEKHGGLDPEQVCWVTERILNALCFLHDHKVIHGGIEPTNIIIREDTHQIVLVDYGFAQVKGKRSSSTGVSAVYASPEQRDNQPITAGSDLYSLGLTMIYALGGDPANIRVPKNVPDPLCAFIKKLIVRDPSKRPTWNGGELLRAMSDVRQDSFGRRSSQMKPLKV